MTTRNKWTRTEGHWTLSLGTRGNRVRVFENPQSGFYYRDIWVDGRKDRKSLKTRDRKKAEQLGKAFLSHLLSGDGIKLPQRVTLSDLWTRFRTECGAWLDNSEALKEG